jgi:DUF4097 and DUF4098 domain-containing protein YvlB
MRIGMVFIIAGVLLFVATLPESVWLSRGKRSETRTGTVINDVLVSGSKTSTSTYQLAEINTLVLETFSGNIEVEISDSMSSEGQFEIIEKADDKRGVKQKPPILDRQGSVLSLKAIQPIACLKCSISYRITLGKAMRLELRNQNGDIIVTGLSNSIKASSSNGDINIAGTGKTILDLESTNGDIVLENLALMPNSQNKIRSENGNITLTQLENSSGISFRGATVNGNLRFDVEGLNFSQRQENEFRASFNGDNPAQLELYSQNGDITLE